MLPLPSLATKALPEEDSAGKTEGTAARRPNPVSEGLGVLRDMMKNSSVFMLVSLGVAVVTVAYPVVLAVKKAQAAVVAAVAVSTFLEELQTFLEFTELALPWYYTQNLMAVVRYIKHLVFREEKGTKEPVAEEEIKGGKSNTVDTK